MYIECAYNGKELYTNHWDLCTVEEGMDDQIIYCPIAEGKHKFVKDLKIPNYLPKVGIKIIYLSAHAVNPLKNQKNCNNHFSIINTLRFIVIDLYIYCTCISHLPKEDLFKCGFTVNRCFTILNRSP